ncbi:uncharacterized protein LOC143543462 isoform X2 [Bidens hawaiensis]|uniref:uncharacterized protein LOC143543462 isoform X2 n=1 Tax=Bidens hawaiensis TaxID=980011 RepID=UPI004049A684
MERIVNISLTANRLNGSIPKELGNISTLRSLVVEENRLSGPVPGELGNLTGIDRLFLSSNYFTGDLPASFANLFNMTGFRISSNSFSGKIPGFIGNWTSLVSLRIQASGLEGPIPSSITLLPTLKDLRISDLKGPDTPCPPFSNTTRFRNLILRSCNLIGHLPEYLAPQDLILLDFSFNKFTGSIPKAYSELNRTLYM